MKELHSVTAWDQFAALVLVISNLKSLNMGARDRTARMKAWEKNFRDTCA